MAFQYSYIIGQRALCQKQLSVGFAFFVEFSYFVDDTVDNAVAAQQMICCLAQKFQVYCIGKLSCGFIFQIVCFVYDDMFMAWQNLIVQFDILQKQCVIGDNQHAVFTGFAVVHIETIARHAALIAKAGFALAGYRCPKLIFQFVQVQGFFITVFCQGEPVNQLRDKYFFAPHYSVCLALILFKPTHTQIIAAPFTQSHMEIKIQTFFQKWNVFVIELFLQCNGVGGYQHTALIFICP